ncbi:MAG TPA: aspartyl/asparaginyl beta-hydroxylase domain-containing protein [Steroidobacteraceae bacterium]|jgi:aspartate beta-hydroxylase|nr:aspartyl/asparaginyl beta-hydroxylase domain-containing protein [Steroidobacteraceae bacterium]
MSASSQAQQLLRQGRIAEGEQLYKQILETSPEDLEALNFTALAALRRREYDRASGLLTKAVEAHPTDFHSRYHLARTHDEAGDLDQALLDYRAALDLQPSSFVARLHLASTLDRGGARDSCLQHYVRALAEAQGQGHWLNPATTPTNLQSRVERAVQLIREAKRGIADSVLSQLREKFGTADMARVSKALRIYLREVTPNYLDPRQHPTFLYFPDLPPSPYPDRHLFPWIERFEACTAVIREEMLQRLGAADGRERVFLNETLERVNLRGIDNEPSWNGYYFYRHGVRREDNCAACPATAAAIDELPLSRVFGHGPEVLYSVFTPGTHLMPHRGVTNTRLVGHLPLAVPEDCALRVGGELHVWQEGRVIVFDDTYEHEAWNRSTGTRVVMIFDIWNPHLTDVERVAVAELIPRMGALQSVDS